LAPSFAAKTPIAATSTLPYASAPSLTLFRWFSSVSTASSDLLGRDQTPGRTGWPCPSRPPIPMVCWPTPPGLASPTGTRSAWIRPEAWVELADGHQPGAGELARRRPDHEGAPKKSPIRLRSEAAALLGITIPPPWKDAPAPK